MFGIISRGELAGQSKLQNQNVCMLSRILGLAGCLCSTQSSGPRLLRGCHSVIPGCAIPCGLRGGSSLCQVLRCAGYKPICFVFPWVGREAAIFITSSPPLGIAFYCVLKEVPFGDPWSHRWSSCKMNRLDSPRSGAQRGCQAEQGPGGKVAGGQEGRRGVGG